MFYIIIVEENGFEIIVECVWTENWGDELKKIIKIGK